MKEKKIKAWAYIDKQGRIGSWDSNREQGMRIMAAKKFTEKPYRDQYGVVGKVVPITIHYHI